MKLKTGIGGLIFLLLLTATMACATAEKKSVSAPSQSEPEWQYHSLVDVEFVKKHIAVPVPENVMLIDARPYKPKYVNGATGEIVVKPGEVEGSMDIDMFKKAMAGTSDSLMIVDVRDTDEFEKGSFKNAVNIPVDHLEGKIKDLPQDKPIVFICSTGARSGEAYYMVQDIRPSLKNSYYLEGACSFKKDGSFEIKKTEG